MKLLVLGLGYVGTANAILLSQHNDVICFDIDNNRVDQINNRKSPIEDKEGSRYLAEKKLNLRAVSDFPNLKDFDFIIIATPTNYSPETNYFDTSSIKSSLEEIDKQQYKSTIIIRSTIPVGFTKSIQKKYPNQEIIFVPEFLREGNALHDNLYPSRIVVGDFSKQAKIFANLLKEGALKKDIQVLFTGPNEAESIKLFANSYLAMRVSYFNEIDSFCETKNLNTQQIIDGVCLDPRIGNHYNNPSFGYGGYCLPKDTKQLLSTYENIPQNIISAIISSNETRMDHITQQILTHEPKTVGIYRLIMKSNSDNFRESSIKGIIERLLKHGTKVVIFEPLINFDANSEVLECQVIKTLKQFKQKSDLIVANRIENDLKDVKDKVYTRDIFNQD